MIELTIDPEQRTAEFSLPEGCPLCGGQLDVRVTATLARSYCGHCHWLGKPQVEFEKQGMSLGLGPSLQA